MRGFIVTAEVILASNETMSKIVTLGLRAKITLAVGLPLLIILFLFSKIHFDRINILITEQTRIMISYAAQMVTGSLLHTFHGHENEGINAILADIVSSSKLERIRIVSLDGMVRFDSQPDNNVGFAISRETPGCVECHQHGQNDRPGTMIIQDDTVLRAAMPLENASQCETCHDKEQHMLALILIDAEIQPLQAQVSREMRVEVIALASAVVLLLASIVWHVNRLVIRRLDRFHEPLNAYRNGDLSARLPVKPAGDEINEIAGFINSVADDIERHEQEKTHLETLRWQSVLEERERLGRELHDGFAQLLGYVNTKVIAIRLLLGSQKLDEADQELEQIEKTNQQLFTDVREAINGLRATGHLKESFSTAIQNYAEQFEQMSNIKVKTVIESPIKADDLEPGISLQLFRIYQEALSNIRKHADATSVYVKACHKNSHFILTIQDDGLGFDMDENLAYGTEQKYGLCIMNERASTIGANLTVESEVGEGTVITISVPIQKGE